MEIKRLDLQITGNKNFYFSVWNLSYGDPFSSFDTKAYLFMIVFVMICSALSYLTAARYLSGRGGKKVKKGADPT